MYPWLLWDLKYRPGCTWTHRGKSASASRTLGWVPLYPNLSTSLEAQRLWDPHCTQRSSMCCCTTGLNSIVFLPMRALNPCIVLSFLWKALSDLSFQVRKCLFYGRSALKINFFSWPRLPLNSQKTHHPFSHYEVENGLFKPPRHQHHCWVQHSFSIVNNTFALAIIVLRFRGILVWRCICCDCCNKRLSGQ